MDNTVKRAMAIFDNEIIRDRIEKRVKSLVMSGAIDTTADEGINAKAVLYTAMLDVANDIKPLSDEGREIVKNLKHF